MDIVVNGRHMEVTDAIRSYVEAKVVKLSKIYDNVMSIEVILDVEADQPLVEMIVHAKRKASFVASHRGQDMYGCVDQCLHKVSEQIRRHKDRVRDRQGAPHSEIIGTTEA